MEIIVIQYLSKLKVQTVSGSLAKLFSKVFFLVDQLGLSEKATRKSLGRGQNLLLISLK